jgi:hypothetical protein
MSTLTMGMVEDMLRKVAALGPVHAPVRIVESWALYDVVEDWSRVRSPGRARRRMRKHRQNIVTRHVPKPDAYVVGGVTYMHPETARRFRAMLKQQ